LSVRINPEGDYSVLLACRYVKTSSASDHKVRLSDYLEDKRDDNPVYWLARYLRKAYGLNLASWDVRSLDPVLRETPIWGWTTNQQLVHFRNRAENCGYPYGFFGFHSLRSGMAVTTLLNHGVLGEASIEQMAVVANWCPRSGAQMNYLREGAQRLIHATDLVRGHSGIRESQKDITPEEFHLFPEPLVALWPQESTVNAFNEACWKVFASQGYDRGEQLGLRRTAWKAWKADIEGGDLTGWILQRLCEDPTEECWDKLVATLVEYAPLKAPKIPRVKPRPISEAKAAREKSRFSKSGQGRRFPWKEEEDLLLLKARFVEDLPWPKVAECLPRRGTEDCWPRLQNLLKKKRTLRQVLEDYKLMDLIPPGGKAVEWMAKEEKKALAPAPASTPTPAPVPKFAGTPKKPTTQARPKAPLQKTPPSTASAGSDKSCGSLSKQMAAITEEAARTESTGRVTRSQLKLRSTT
jgi:hypothetical protein